MKSKIFTITTLLLLAGAMVGQIGAQEKNDNPDLVPAYTPPPAGASKPVVLPPIQEKMLSNGLKVIVVEQHELPVVSLRLMCKAGSFLDPAGKAGLTQFMTGLLTQGTQTLSATQIAQKIEFVGGSINASSGWDASYVECTVLTKYLDTATDLFREVTLHPAFANEEVERLRKQTLSGIESDKDQPGSLADNEFHSWLFKDYPFANPIEGTETTVTSFTAQDILSQYHLIFVPNNAVLAVVGDVDAKTASKVASKILGDWTKGAIPTVNATLPMQPSGLSIHVVNKSDATQSQIRMGHLGVSRKSEDFFPLTLMNYILGGGGFSSRLMKEVRSKMGLTYGISSSYAMRMEPGEFVINTFTKNESVRDAIRASLDLVKKYQQEGPTTKEMDEAKAYLTGSYPMNFETPSQIAGQLLNIELYGLGKDYIEKYRSRIEAITAEEVRRVANKYLSPDNMDIVVVGKAQDVETPLKDLAPVKVVEIQ
jgi:zinc protease